MSKTKAHAPSTLQLELEQVVEDHPEISLHPYSPSGPYVRAVLWLAAGGLLKGQAFWEPDGEYWVVRAMKVYSAEEPMFVGLYRWEEIPAAISDVIRRLS